MKSVINKLMLLTGIGCSFCHPAYSGTMDKLHFSGFGTIGLVLSDSDNYGYRLDSSYDEGVYSGDVDILSISNLGLQLDFMATDTSQLTLQMVLKQESSPSLSRYISQAFYKYNISPSVEIRIGRTALDLFALTEYRNVSFAYPWAVAPNEVYGLFPHRHLDGIDISYTFHPATGSVRTKLFAGKSEGDIVVLGNAEEVGINDMIGFSVSWGELNWGLKASYTHGVFDVGTIDRTAELMAGFEEISSTANSLAQFLPTPPFPGVLWASPETAINDLVFSGESVEYGSISGHYSWDQWTVMAEASQVDSSSSLVPKVIGSYVSLAYAKGKSTYYGLVAQTKSTPHEFDEGNVSPLFSETGGALTNSAIVGPTLATAFQSLQDNYPALIAGNERAMKFFSSNQVTYTLGWRYDLQENVALNLQWNHTEIDHKGGTLWLEHGEYINAESINTVFCNVSYIF